jgi:hypothetical protein
MGPFFTAFNTLDTDPGVTAGGPIGRPILSGAAIGGSVLEKEAAAPAVVRGRRFECYPAMTIPRFSVHQMAQPPGAP